MLVGKSTSGMGMMLLAVLVGSSSQALAADLGGSTKDTPVYDTIEAPRNPWTLSVRTYAWLPWITGDAIVRGRSFDVDLSPRDILSALDWSTLPTWMSTAEVRRGRFGFFNDIVYSKLSGSSGFSGSGPGGLATLNSNISAKYTQATIEFGAAYEVFSSRQSEMAQSTTFDILAGARYWHQKVSVSADLDVNVALPGLPLGPDGRVIARSGSVDWLDPFIGMRMHHQLAPGQKITARGDIGGFGIGSDFTWQALAAYEFQIAQREGYLIDGYLGYRALSVDYSQGSGATQYEYDTIQHGPVLGLTMRY